MALLVKRRVSYGQMTAVIAQLPPTRMTSDKPGAVHMYVHVRCQLFLELTMPSAKARHSAMRYLCQLILVAFTLPGLSGGAMAQVPRTFAFDIEISLSGKARKALRSRHEPLVVLVSYYAAPTKQARRYADEVGYIHLSPGPTAVELPLNATRVHISGKQVRRELLARINGPVMVNVNIVSGRRSTPDNLLSCDVVDRPLKAVQKIPVRLNCGLITEHRKTRVKP